MILTTKSDKNNVRKKNQSNEYSCKALEILGNGI